MDKIQMVDLVAQYRQRQGSIDSAIAKVLSQGQYINGPFVREFENNLSSFLKVEHVISCANGTDALQIALMALDLDEGDEVIIPSFTYASIAEVVCLLKLRMVLVDIDLRTYNMDASKIESAITEKTKVIVPVHLFGQCVDMTAIMRIAEKHELYVIEDNAQSLGAKCQVNKEQMRYSGTISHIGCTSFFPTKNLGCYGDGGALMTSDDKLAEQIRMIASHGQSKKYHHDRIGVNSRLDAIQAAVLDVKLTYLRQSILSRQRIGDVYESHLGKLEDVICPYRAAHSDHTFNQYTIRVPKEVRHKLQFFLKTKSVPTKIYYPKPLNEQKAYTNFWRSTHHLEQSKQLCSEVLSLPIHPVLGSDQLEYICSSIKSFFT